jgi:hypothetical protein
MTASKTPERKAFGKQIGEFGLIRENSLKSPLKSLPWNP